MNKILQDRKVHLQIHSVNRVHDHFVIQNDNQNKSNQNFQIRQHHLHYI